MTTRAARTIRLLSTTPLLFWAAFTAQPTWAQANGAAPPAANPPPSGSQLQEVVVTARKRPELSQRVPATITSINGDQLAAAHATRLDDLGGFVSNLNIVTRADNTPDVTIRGVGAYGVTPGVGFYVNDVPQFEGESVRPNDISNIEVLKGPQGTLYGGNNIGGAIRYTTALPTSTSHAEFGLSGGSYDDRELSGVVSGPLASHLQARFSGFLTEDGGFVKDPTLNTTLGGQREQGGRLTLRFDMGDTTATLYLFGDKLHSRNENLYYAPDRSDTYSLEVTANVQPYYNRTVYQPALVLEHRLGDGLTLTSITSYFLADSDARTDGDHRAAPIFDVYQTLNTHVVTQELRLASTAQGPFKWVVGVYGQRLGQFFVEQNHFDFSFLDGNPTDFGVQLSQTRHTQQSAALFANGVYTAGAIDFEVGLRAETYQNTLEDLLGATKALAHDSVFLPRLSLTYHVTEAVLAYASASSGIEPSDNIAENAAISSYKAERTLNYEVGEKGTFFNRRLRFNADIFYIDYDNRLFNTIDGATLQGITRNIGPSYNYGLELDTALQITRELTFSGGLGLTQAVWKHAIVFDPTLNATVDLNGKIAPFTPDYQANLGLAWRHLLSDKLYVGLHASAVLYGSQWWDVTDHYQQRPYSIANFGASLEFKNYVFAFDIKNAFDTRYNTIFAAAEEIGAPFNTASIGRPSEAFISLSAKF